MRELQQVAGMLGMRTVSLVADYLTPDGRDEHMTCQAIGRDVQTIAAHARCSLEGQGLRVMCLYTVEGDMDADTLGGLTPAQARQIYKSGGFRVWYLDDALRDTFGHLCDADV